MTAPQFHRQLAKVKPPAHPVAMLRQIPEVWPNDDLAAIPLELDLPALVSHFLQKKFIKQASAFEGSGIELPEVPDSIFELTILPRPSGYLCKVAFVAGPMCACGAEFQFSHEGVLNSDKEFPMWIS